MRKTTLKVGDKVSHVDFPLVDGVIVFQLDLTNPLNRHQNEWNVHWCKNSTKLGDRLFCKTDELIKAKPKIGITTDEGKQEKHEEVH